MKKKIILISFITLAIVLLTFAFFWQKAAYNNGFYRKVLSQKNELKKQINLENVTSLACNTNSDIWIQQRDNPLTIITVNDSLNSQKETKILPPRYFNLKLRNYYYSNTDFSTMLTNESGDIARITKDKSEYFKVRYPKFDLSISSSPNTIFVRSFVRIKGQNRLQITKIKITDTASVLSSYILPKQIDGIFCADGRLNYDPENSRLYYMYYYRGEFLCLDTNLNLLYKAKTIDTVHVAKLGIKYYKESSTPSKATLKRTVTGVSRLVNHYFNVGNNNIYILSALKADNQSATDFLAKNTIDVYSAGHGNYLYSFDIPKYRETKLREFRIKGNNFYAFYKNNLVWYSLDELK